MAVNNAVTVSAGLTCSLLSTPTIGASASLGMAFTAGDTASDSYINVATTTTPLNADIGGNGFIFVQNPATNEGVANANTIEILCASQAMGPLPPGASVVLPLKSTTVYNATSAPAAQAVGVTVIECDPNS